MCGIFGYVGRQEALPILLLGLSKLEYRGYDSAGIAGPSKGKLVCSKAVGKLSDLRDQLEAEPIQLEGAAIGHTRWATHGRPSELNAHPHFDREGALAVVHNGIIENHEALRSEHCRSETDSEVIAHLISSLYKGDLLQAVQMAMPRLKGALAIAVMHRDHPNQIVVAARESPLAIGVGNGECFVASDTHAFLVHTHEVVYLHGSEVALVEADGFKVFDERAEEVVKQRQQLAAKASDVSKGAYSHYMLKEIFEQPQTVRNALLSRCLEQDGTAIFEDLPVDLSAVRRLLLIGCGSSYHAGLVNAYMVEQCARLPVRVEIASELRYKNPVIEKGTLAIAISQSGETADTLAAVREVKARGVPVLALCNVQESSLTREADGTLLLRAGPEIGVASTKAYTGMQVVLALFALRLARLQHMSQEEGQKILRALKALPDQLQSLLDRHEEIWRVASAYREFRDFFFIGRLAMYPTALEGALKLKEISYVNASGYPAGEMKHGPIALIDEGSAVVGCCGDKKLINNLMEMKARGARIVAIAAEGTTGLESVTEEIIWVPKTVDSLAGIPTSVAIQLFAYDIALGRGASIDQPRNLAKSVTVE